MAGTRPNAGGTRLSVRTIGSIIADVFTGGRFFSRWSWLGTLPFAVTVLGGYIPGEGPAALALGFVAAVGVHLAVGAIMLAAAAAERAATSRALRGATVVVALVAIAIARPAVGDVLRELVGLDPFPVPMPARIVANLATASVALTLIAVAARTIRRRSAVRAALTRVVAALEREHSAGRRLVALAEEAVRDVQRDLLAALDALRRLQPVGWPAALRAFSADTARRASHRLFEGRTALAELDPLCEPVEPERVRSIALAAPPPGLVATLYTVTLLPYAITQLSGDRLLAATTITIALGLVGDLLTGWAAHRTHGATRTAAILTGPLLIALVIEAVDTVLLDGHPLALVSGLPYVFLALVASLCTGTVRRLDEDERQLAARLGSYRIDEAEGRREADAVLANAARVLHNEVQGDCLTAAIRLEAGSIGLDDLDDLLDDMRVCLEELTVPDEATSAAPQEQLDALLVGWRHALSLTAQVEPDALERLDASALRLLLDAISEAFTNVLRHSDHPVASVAVTDSADGVLVEVTSPGRFRATATPGHGLADLATRARALTLGQVGDDVVLTMLVEPAAAGRH